MGWFYVVIAGIFEVGFMLCMKNMDDHKNLWWSTGFYICIISSFGFLQEALKTLPLGTAYAVWTGIGSIGTVVIGMIWFAEPTNVWRILFLSTLILSILGLKFTSGH